MTDLPRLACTLAPSIRLPEHARVAEELGYERVWVYDSPALYTDIWVTLARAVEATELIGVATGVAVPFLRHPMVTASAIATIAELGPGRVAVAFGTGFTGARTLGLKPMRWADLAEYVSQVRGLLAGDVVEVDGHRVRMIHSPGFAPPRPIDVPMLVAPMGPKGYEVAQRVADGIIVAAPPGNDEWPWCALLCSGTVLDPGEDHTTPRVIESAGIGFATGLHGIWEMAPEMLPTVPGGAEWLAALEAEFDQADRHWAAHQGHLVAIADRDRPVVAKAGAAILTSGWTGDAASVRQRAVEAAEGGVTELAYAPAGPDIARELEAFAAAVRS